MQTRAWYNNSRLLTGVFNFDCCFGGFSHRNFFFEFGMIPTSCLFCSVQCFLKGFLWRRMSFMVLLEDVFPGVNELWLLFRFFARYSVFSVSAVCYARSKSIYIYIWKRERENHTTLSGKWVPEFLPYLMFSILVLHFSLKGITFPLSVCQCVCVYWHKGVQSQSQLHL